MIKFEKKEIEVTVISPYITQRLRELIAQDKDFQRDIEDGVFGYMFDHNLYDVENGWQGEEPDRIVINIPLSVYPTRARCLEG